MAGREELRLKRETAKQLFDFGYAPSEIRARTGMSKSWVYKYCKCGRTEINWSHAEIEQLARMREMNMGWDKIAARLDRSEMSCRVKYSRELKRTRMDVDIKNVLKMLVWAQKKAGVANAGKLLDACRRADIFERYFNVK